MVEIVPMSEEYIHIHCLHHGPVDPKSPPVKGNVAVEGVNLPPHPWNDEDIIQVVKASGAEISHGWRGDPAKEFMREMIHRYDSCAMLAWEEGKIVGQLRFYPRHIMNLLEKAGVHGPIPWQSEEPEKTLHIHCVMTSMPYTNDIEGRARGARRGTGQQLVHALVVWAKERKWIRIEAEAHPDLDFLYGHWNSSGRRFWLKAGFKPASSWRKELSTYPVKMREILEREIAAKGMSTDEAETWYQMVRLL